MRPPNTGPPDMKASVVLVLLFVLYVGALVALSAFLDSAGFTALVMFPLILLPIYALLIASYRTTGARNIPTWIGVLFVTAVWLAFASSFVAQH